MESSDDSEMNSILLKKLDKTIFLNTFKKFINDFNYADIFNKICVDDLFPLGKIKELVAAYLYYFVVLKKNEKELNILTSFLMRLETGESPTKHQLLYIVYYLSNLDCDNKEENKLIRNLYS